MAIEALAVLSASLAIAADVPGLVVVALVLLVLGLVGYAWVLNDFDFDQLVTGRGDHWVAGGAMAISALAAGRIVLAVDATGGLADLRSLMDGVAVALVIAALAWLPPLVVCELVRPRLGFSALRWATVFPVGMYAAAAFTAGAASKDPWMTSFAQVWVWVGVAVWAVVAAATVARGTSLLLQPAPRTRGSMPE
ncbi:MAG: SLAC1 family transporter [Solirubrobacteraceae bacterium]